MGEMTSPLPSHASHFLCAFKVGNLRLACVRTFLDVIVGVMGMVFMVNSGIGLRLRDQLPLCHGVNCYCE